MKKNIDMMSQLNNPEEIIQYIDRHYPSINVKVDQSTYPYPLQLIGRAAGICIGANIDNPEKNIKRAYDCIAKNHGRTLEYPKIMLSISGVSARVVRELYTHIVDRSALQKSTRYSLDENKPFDYIVPPKTLDDPIACAVYVNTMKEIQKGINKLKQLNISNEEATMLLPLGMDTTIAVEYGLRELALGMGSQRLCTKAFEEYRVLMLKIIFTLADYSDEYKELLLSDTSLFKPKCYNSKCSEGSNCCRALGQYPLDVSEIIRTYINR